MTEPAAAHRHSHRNLLRPRRFRSDRTVDAVVVSAARSALNLVPAMELADALGTRLVALCSGAARADVARDYAAEYRHGDFTFVDVSDYQPPETLRFAADQSEVRVARLGDLSRKRNLGLYLAHLCSWRTVLLLDDDIRELSLRTVRWATETLPSGGVTGMLAQDFPDNSVVCHARRAAGLTQRVFISGSALLVDTTQVDSYFPEVYNEDWLFMHDRIRAGRASALGSVRQLRYEPYEDPRRAAGEEFGDTLAEGLMSLAHTGWPAGGSSMGKWWRAVLRERRSMLDRLIDILPDGDSGNAVVEARKQHDYLTADFFADYVQSWRQDLVDFPKRLLDVRGGMPLPDAVAHLRLVACQHTGDQFFEPGGTVVPGLPAAAS